MTVTPIFDEVSTRFGEVLPAAYADEVTDGGGIVVRGAGRPSPAPRPPLAGATAFGQGCLAAVPGPGGVEPAGGADEFAGLLAGARREALALGHHRVDTLHVLLAVVRSDAEIGRVFGMRGVGTAVLAVAAGPPDEDPTTPADGPELSAVARTVLQRLVHRARAGHRSVSAADVAVAVARTPRVAELLVERGVDLDDLVDVLVPGDDHATPTRLLPRAVAPVTVMLPAPGRAPDHPDSSDRTDAWTSPLLVAT
ncbi:Clp protease N-terminal domain-containing protein [Actinomycetospora sp. OC33-EN08]|uniref:Clp protease N-terminal domain-containing protein n=1 Tax=Actinomycetospora aurantiaca TaxID=3129233 RepID=A0ABU8MZL8_9PSEU